VNGGEGHLVDSCRPILLWEPDPTCDHEQNDDCEHFAIWVDTRVARDTLARASMVLALREFDDDDLDGDEDVTVSDGISVTCALETGVIVPLERTGAIFLRHHPWLVESLRAELDFFRRRAARASAQFDRETTPRRALASPVRTMVAYHKLFPADWDLVPFHDGERYWAVDLYCRNPDCTCTSSVINFYRLENDDDREVQLIGEVVVDYAEREIDYEPSNEVVEKIFDTLWDACEYQLRARHAEAHDAVQRFAPRAAPAIQPAALVERVPRNAACPCGSGKKYKRCCLDATRTDRSSTA
jgi:hypothetical protein